MSDADKYLEIYLNDNLAGATVGVELAKRAAGANKGTELGAFLRVLRGEIEADRAALLEIMDALGASVDRPKSALAWLGEKAGRLKLNGRLLGYSPLSRLVELEFLSLAIEGKRLLWVTLGTVAGHRLDPERLMDLIDRAQQQRADLEPFRLEAARKAAGAPARVPAGG